MRNCIYKTINHLQIQNGGGKVDIKKSLTKKKRTDIKKRRESTSKNNTKKVVDIYVKFEKMHNFALKKAIIYIEKNANINIDYHNLSDDR